VPFGSLQVIVEPSQQNLIWRQPQEFLQSLPVIQQPVQLGMNLDINLGEQTPSDNLPDQTENQMFSSLCNIGRTNVDDGASDTLC
jgi:hypothetical protein